MATRVRSLDDPNDLDIRLTRKPGVSATSVPRSLYKQSCNTGPKGVKRDYEIAKRNLIAEKRFDALRAHREFHHLANQMTQFHLTESQPEQKSAAAKEKKKDALLDDDGSNSDDSIFGKDDDGFDSEEERLFEKMKRDRIAALQNSLPTFGEYYRVDTFEDFTVLIKSAHELAITVVHVYQNYIPACQSLHLTFELIAPQFPHVCFVRIRSDELFKNRKYSPKGLPTLLLYRGENLFHSSVPATIEAFGGVEDPHPRTVVQWLADKGCLKLPTGGLDKLDFKQVKAIRDAEEDRELLDGNETIERALSAAGSKARTILKEASKRASRTKLRKGMSYQVKEYDDYEDEDNDGSAEDSDTQPPSASASRLRRLGGDDDDQDHDGDDDDDADGSSSLFRAPTVRRNE